MLKEGASRRGILTSATSLTWADTEYMPDAKATQQSINGLVTSNTNKQVLWLERLACVSMGVAQLAKQLLQRLLVRIGIAVQAQQVDIDTIGSLIGNI
ncbi:hypothetical protein HG531_010319 [Fusarium graminearum]|nr:hypothetical protein HG531_010319 [Fusarium graminearum]